MARMSVNRAPAAQPHAATRREPGTCRQLAAFGTGGTQRHARRCRYLKKQHSHIDSHIYNALIISILSILEQSYVDVV